MTGDSATSGAPWGGPVRGFCVAPGQGLPLPGAGGEALATAGRTGGQLSVVISHAPPGDQVSRHVHHRGDECFYVLAGHYRVDCGPESFHAPPGSLVYLPRGVPHGYTVGDAPGATLILAIPAGIEDFFVDLAAGVDLHTLADRHGISFLEPGDA